jgi:hypothetical protein
VVAYKGFFSFIAWEVVTCARHAYSMAISFKSELRRTQVHANTESPITRRSEAMRSLQCNQEAWGGTGIPSACSHSNSVASP